MPHPAQQGRVREGPLAWCPQLRHGSAQAKLLFKRFSWRHKGLLTSLMPPFNTELFRIPSRLCFYSEWQGTFPLGKLEKCFCFFFFFLSSFSVSIYFSSKIAGLVVAAPQAEGKAQHKLTASAFQELEAGGESDGANGVEGTALPVPVPVMGAGVSWGHRSHPAPRWRCGVSPWPHRVTGGTMTEGGGQFLQKGQMGVK